MGLWRRKQGQACFPIWMKILLAFLALCTGLAAVSGLIYYRQAEKVVLDSIRDQTSLLCDNVMLEFQTRYADPIERELRLLTSAPQLNDLLMSSQTEFLLHRAEGERLFLSWLKGCNIHTSTTFLDGSGMETVIVEGATRKRNYRPLASATEGDVMRQHVRRLFLDLASDRSRTVASSSPFIDNQGRAGLAVGRAVQEPEAGGFGGVIVQHCILTGFIEKLAGKKVLGAPVVWIRGRDGRAFLSPPEDGPRSDPWRFVDGKSRRAGT